MSKVTTDALEILEQLIYKDLPPHVIAEKKRIGRIKCEVGQIIYDLRQEAGVSQKQLGPQAGISGEDLDALELGSFDGDTATLIEKVASLLNPSDPVKAQIQEHCRALRESTIDG